MGYGRRRSAEDLGYTRTKLPSNVVLDSSGQFAVAPPPPKAMPALQTVNAPPTTAVAQPVLQTVNPAPAPSTTPYTMSVAKPPQPTQQTGTAPAFDAPDATSLATKEGEYYPTTPTDVAQSIDPKVKKALLTGAIVLTVIGILYYVRRKAS